MSQNDTSADETGLQTSTFLRETSRYSHGTPGIHLINMSILI